MRPDKILKFRCFLIEEGFYKKILGKNVEDNDVFSDAVLGRFQIAAEREGRKTSPALLYKESLS